MLTETRPDVIKLRYLSVLLSIFYIILCFLRIGYGIHILSSTFLLEKKIRAFFNSGFTLYKKWKKCGTEMSKLNRYLEFWTYLKREMQNVQTDGNSIVSEVSRLISLSTFDAVYLVITLSDQRRR